MSQPKGKGRAALRDLLLRAQSIQPSVGVYTPVTESTGATPTLVSKDSTEIPKARGRAALIAALTRPRVAATPPGSNETVEISEAKTSETKLIKVTEPELFKKGAKGISGKEIPVQANYIKLNKEEGKGIYRYEVQFSPNIDSKRARCKLVQMIKDDLGGVTTFNGMSDLYLPRKVDDILKVFQREHPYTPGTIVQISIIYKRLEPYGTNDSIHFLNVLFKRIMNILKLQQIKRNYFDFSNVTLIPQYCLEVIPGYAVAVDELEGGLMICLDTCHKILRKKTVLELLLEIRQQWPHNFKEKAISELLGRVVLTSYANTSYIIDDIFWDANPTDTFETKNGPVSYISYYKNQYNVEIQNTKQPLLINMKRKKTGILGEEREFIVCLVPELCNLTGISQDMMTGHFKKEMAQHTRLPPAKRFAILKKYIQNVRNNPDASKLLKDWGLTIADGVIDLNARIIGDNKIEFLNKQICLNNVQDWGRDCARNNLIQPVDMIDWIVLCPDRDQRTTEQFVKRLQGLARGFGCTITYPRLISVGKGQDANYRDVLEKYVADNIQMVLIIVPTARDSLYAIIKNTTLARKGILAQVVKLSTIQNDRIITSITLNIGMQMQAKMGGALWAIVFPKVCNDFMFCGIDTFHSPSLKKSVGAFTATTDERHTSYYTGIAFQVHEIADALKLHFKRSLQMRKSKTGKYPNHVFIVRDGVGDGQLQYVKDYELRQYLEVSNELGINFKMCFIVIQKRTNTRLMLHNGQNPYPGTVVDHTITRLNYEDFYLVPQSAKIGTVSPSHYIILHNDSPALSLERIQKLCYKLCHIYYNWTGAVSVPAPCQYAHKAAYLIGEHMERKPLETLSDKLYYL